MPESPEVLHLIEIIQCKIKNKDLVSIKIQKGRYVNHGPPNNFKEFVKLFEHSKKGRLFLYTLKIIGV